jgi:hypothetical protein
LVWLASLWTGAAAAAVAALLFQRLCFDLECLELCELLGGVLRRWDRGEFLCLALGLLLRVLLGVLGGVLLEELHCLLLRLALGLLLLDVLHLLLVGLL